MNKIITGVAGGIVVIVVIVLDVSNPIDQTMRIYFNDQAGEANPGGLMVFGNRLVGDIESDPSKPIERVGFIVQAPIGYPIIEIPEVLADSVEQACVEKEYRILPSRTECYQMERV